MYDKEDLPVHGVYGEARQCDTNPSKSISLICDREWVEGKEIIHANQQRDT